MDVENTVGIDIEGDFDLRNTTGCGWDASEFELAEQVVVLCSSTLTLVDLDQDTRLVVRVGREDFGFLGGDGGVSLDKRSHDTSSGLDTHGQWGNIQQKKVLSFLAGVTGENSSLDGSTIRDG